MSTFVSRVYPVNASIDDVIATTLLATVNRFDIALKKSHHSHTTGSAEPPKGNSSNPTLDKIKDGSRYVDKAIIKLVSRVLSEDVPVAGISRPISQIVKTDH